jgi:protocatechuate 3,4-dioxygenase beta subunit
MEEASPAPTPPRLFDVATRLERRRALKLFAGAGLLAFVGCGSDDGTSSPSSTTGGSTTTAAATSTTGGSTTTAAAAGEAIPEETAGPYPGDGSNGPNVLTQDGVVRSDITASFGEYSGTATGVPLVVDLVVTDADSGSPMAGAAVYLWHCDKEGRYSLYSQGATDQNYLRGVQEADGSGNLSFTTIFPGAYSGRWPHIHFEVFASLDDATSGGTPVATSQLALPEDICDVVYATDGYSASVRNMTQTTLERDNVFRDGVDQQMASMSGSVGSGLTASLTVPV